MKKIRSNLKGPITFSPKSGNVTIARSNVQGKPEFLNEISEDDYKALTSDKSGSFNALIKNGDLQIINDEEEQESSEPSGGVTPEEVEKIVLKRIQSYKEGEGAELLQSALNSKEEDLNELFSEEKRELAESHQESLDEQKRASDFDFKNIREKAVKEAVAEVKDGLIKKHNKEVQKEKLIKW